MKRRRTAAVAVRSVNSDVGEDLCPSPSKLQKMDHMTEKSGMLADDVCASLAYLKTQFPLDKFQAVPPLPSIVLQHQLYSLIQDRTSVDRELLSLRDIGTVRIFKLGLAGDDYAIVDEEEYHSYLKSYFKLKGCLSRHHRVIHNLLPSFTDVSVTEQQLKGELKMTEGQISELVRCGVLLVRAVGGGEGRSWWFAIPGLSPFTRSLTHGRRLLKQWLQRSKCNEMLQSELESRKCSVSKLSIHYHIHDLIGADVVECVDTTSGPLLRLLQDHRRW